jgi:nucleoside diphosphate kinase
MAAPSYGCEWLMLADVDWDRTVFAMICPDALARHLGVAVLERFREAGCRPVAWRVFWHRPAGLDAFNEQNIKDVWDSYMYRLVDQVFAFGPTVALLLADENLDRSEESHQRLRRLKGASEPYEATCGTIRGDLRATNVMLDLVHCSDSAADSQYESSVFAGPGLLPGTDTGDLRIRLELLQHALPAEQRGHPEVLAALRARMLAAAWDSLPHAARKEGVVLAHSGIAGLTAPGSGERMASLLPADHALADAFRADFTPPAPGPPIDRLRAALRMFGTDIDAWERLVLATSQRFWSRGAPGYPPPAA